MTEKRYRLKATKTQLYNLVKQHFGISVGIRQTEFIKHFRARDYSLNFWDGAWYHFFLGAVAGSPMLSSTVTVYDDYGARSETYTVHRLELKELIAMGMAEEIPPQK